MKINNYFATARDPNELLVYPEGNVSPGKRLTYRVEYENEGEGIAYGVYFTDTLDIDLDDTTLVFLRNLEEAVILLLEDYGICSYRQEGLTGVWVEQKKIASLGIAISHWVTTHGLSLNVSCDLNLFSLIKPCGLDIMMTSMVDLKKLNSLKMEGVKEKMINKFRHLFSDSFARCLPVGEAGKA